MLILGSISLFFGISLIILSYIPSINLSYRLDNENAQLYDAIIKSLQNTLDSIEFGLGILLVIQGLSLIIPNFNF